MKQFAYYLPQFHEIPENDKWWGKGFTEWVNVRKAKPLYPNHYQPKIPLNNNYYCLLDKSVLQWQANLAGEYKLDGFIFYHYYFKGKKLLEKPAEILLNNKDIKMNYFFCWANHSWSRTWDGSRKILMKMEYGTEKDWEKHFQYLLPFFKDKRYEKKDNKPLFLLFSSDFPEKNEMIKYFNRRCSENGFDGICVIETMSSYQKKDIKRMEVVASPYTQYIHFREPGPAFFTLKGLYNRLIHHTGLLYKILLKKGYVRTFDGDYLLRNAIRHVKRDKRYIPGMCFSWDNTPRHENRGYIIKPVSKQMYFNYMNSINDADYIFINAWNEWCEGMILEPTEKEGFKYLEWIKEYVTTKQQ